jgi:hypothetical protein
MAGAAQTSVTEPSPATLSRRKRFVFATVAVVLGLAVSLGTLLALDVWLHYRLEQWSGFSVWGYRRPAVGRKAPGEQRIVVLGGSTAFGWGVPWDEAFPARLEAALRPLARNGAPVTVVNLGMPLNGAYSFRFTLEDYAGLDYDAVVLYEGYNDLRGPNHYVGRRESPLFRLTGYYPILPLAVWELTRVGATTTDREGRPIFRPGHGGRSAEAVQAAGRVGKALEAQLERFAANDAVRRDGETPEVFDAGCVPRWAHYCGAVYEAIQYALGRGARVLVVTQPYIPDPHREEQQALREMLVRYFAGNPRVGYADLGDVIDTRTSPLAYDGMHLSKEGNGVIAAHLVRPIAELMPEGFRAPDAAAAGAGSP